MRLALLKPRGPLCLIGVPPDSLPLFPDALVFGEKIIVESLIGGIKPIQDMMAFAHQHNVAADIELIQHYEPTTAWAPPEQGDVRYRFVIDLAPWWIRAMARRPNL